MYLHVTPDMRVRECPDYRKGFCPKGACSACGCAHVRMLTTQRVQVRLAR